MSLVQLVSKEPNEHEIPITVTSDKNNKSKCQLSIDLVNLKV